MKKILAAFAVVTLVTTGCINSGSSKLKDVDYSSIEQTLVRGQTTKSEVIALYGKPQLTNIIDGQEQWTYNRSKIVLLLNVIPETTTLNITFSGDTVSDYVFSQSNQPVSQIL